MQGGYTLLRPSREGSLYLSGLFALALLVALFVPVIVRSRGVLDSERLRLLPITPRAFYLLRLLGNHPLRMLLALSALLWGWVGLASLPRGAGVALLEAVQLVGWAVGGIMAVQLAEDLLSPRAPMLFFLPAFLVAVEGIQLLLLYSSVHRDLIPGLGETGGSGSVILLGGGASAGELALAAALLTVCLALAWIGRAVAGRYARPSRPPGRATYLSRTISAVSVRIAPSAPATLWKEIALVLRLAFSRTFLAVTLVVSLTAFMTGIPWLLPAAFLGWLVFSHNLLGGDLPLGGRLRYDLLPLPLTRVFWRRHVAVLLVASLSVLMAGLIAALVGGRIPLLHAGAAYAFGAGLFAWQTVAGDRVSLRYPKEVGLRTLLLQGGYVSPIAWVSLAVGGALAGAIFTGVLQLARILPLSDAADRAVAALCASTLIFTVFYGLSLAAHLRRGA